MELKHKARLSGLCNCCFLNMSFQHRKHIAESVVDLLADKKYFTARIAAAGQEKELDKQVVTYLNIAQDAMKVYELQESLSWLNMRGHSKRLSMI